MSSVRERALSYAQARRCEDALHPRCRCRCNGTLHGAKRGSVLDLPLNDPHSPSTLCPYCGGRGVTPIGIPCQECLGGGRIRVRGAVIAARVSVAGE